MISKNKFLSAMKLITDNIESATFLQRFCEVSAVLLTGFIIMTIYGVNDVPLFSNSNWPEQTEESRLSDGKRIIDGIHKRNADEFAAIEKAADCHYANSYDGGNGWVQGCHNTEYLYLPEGVRNLYVTRTLLTLTISESLRTWEMLCLNGGTGRCDESTAGKRQRLARASAVFAEANEALQALNPQLGTIYYRAKRAAEVTTPDYASWNISSNQAWNSVLKEQHSYREKLELQQAALELQKKERWQKLSTKLEAEAKTQAEAARTEQKLEVYLYDGEAWENVTVEVLWAAITMVPKTNEIYLFMAFGLILVVAKFFRWIGTDFEKDFSRREDLTTPRIIKGTGWLGLPILVGGYNRSWKVGVSFWTRTTVLTDGCGNSLCVNDVKAPYLPELLASSSLDDYLRKMVSQNQATSIGFRGQHRV